MNVNNERDIEMLATFESELWTLVMRREVHEEMLRKIAVAQRQYLDDVAPTLDADGPSADDANSPTGIVIQGHGGHRRYYVRRDGSIDISPRHTVDERILAQFRDLTWSVY